MFGKKNEKKIIDIKNLENLKNIKKVFEKKNEKWKN